MRKVYLLAIILLSTVINMSAQRRGRVDHAAVAAEAKAAAQKALLSYNVDEAAAQIDRWAESLDALKKEYPAEMETMRDRLRMIRNMLERVERIEIVDSFTVDSVGFFSHYRLSPDAGSLLDASVLPDEYASAAPKVVYMPQSEKEMFWAIPQPNGASQLVVADVLDNGQLEMGMNIGETLGEDDADFPFMMQDGVTFYYAAKGDGSLGGYDIFMTRRDAEGDMLQPQNMGMPYNSPYNDFLLAIDETNDLGWWASDREQIPGKVTIYVFVPSKMRVNHAPDSDRIADYALVRNVDMTYDLDSRLASTSTEADDAEGEIFFSLGDSRVYTSLSQFKNPQARQAMKNLLKRMFDAEVAEAELAALRQRYASGDKTVANDILRLEKQERENRAAIKRNTNQVINLENKGKN